MSDDWWDFMKFLQQCALKSFFLVFGKKDAQQYSGCNHHGISVADVAGPFQDRPCETCSCVVAGVNSKHGMTQGETRHEWKKKFSQPSCFIHIPKSDFPSYYPILIGT